MKKTILSGAFTVVMCLFANVTTAQNVETIARKAAKEAGCITDNGAVDCSVNVIGVCTSGSYETNDLIEVYILPKVNAHIAPYVKLAPYARVTMCGSEVVSVECF